MPITFFMEKVIIDFNSKHSRAIPQSIYQYILSHKFEVCDNGVLQQIKKGRASLTMKIVSANNTQVIPSSQEEKEDFFYQVKSKEKNKVIGSLLNCSGFRFMGLSFEVELSKKVGQAEGNGYRGTDRVSLFYNQGVGLYIPQLVGGFLPCLHRVKRKSKTDFYLFDFLEDEF